jgi:hypothetical protein
VTHQLKINHLRVEPRPLLGAKVICKLYKLLAGGDKSSQRQDIDTAIELSKQKGVRDAFTKAKKVGQR